MFIMLWNVIEIWLSDCFHHPTLQRNIRLQHHGVPNTPNTRSTSGEYFTLLMSEKGNKSINTSCAAGKQEGQQARELSVLIIFMASGQEQ